MKQKEVADQRLEWLVKNVNASLPDTEYYSRSGQPDKKAKEYRRHFWGRQDANGFYEYCIQLTCVLRNGKYYSYLWLREEPLTKYTLCKGLPAVDTAFARKLSKLQASTDGQWKTMRQARPGKKGGPPMYAIHSGFQSLTCTWWQQTGADVPCECQTKTFGTLTEAESYYQKLIEKVETSLPGCAMTDRLGTKGRLKGMLAARLLNDKIDLSHAVEVALFAAGGNGYFVRLSVGRF